MTSFGKKNQRVTTGFLTGLPGHTGFFFPLFFLQPGPIPAPGRPAGPGQVLKLWVIVKEIIKKQE